MISIVRSYQLPGPRVLLTSCLLPQAPFPAPHIPHFNGGKVFNTQSLLQVNDLIWHPRAHFDAEAGRPVTEWGKSWPPRMSRLGLFLTLQLM
jgi:hypothetical protein